MAAVNMSLSSEFLAEMPVINRVNITDISLLEELIGDMEPMNEITLLTVPDVADVADVAASAQAEVLTDQAVEDPEDAYWRKVWKEYGLTCENCGHCDKCDEYNAGEYDDDGCCSRYDAFDGYNGGTVDPYPYGWHVDRAVEELDKQFEY